MSLEDISAVEALLRRSTRAGAETADHCAFVVGQGMPVLVIFARKSLDVVLASLDRTLLRTLGLMGEHVSLQVLEGTTAIWDWADSLLLVLFAQLVAATAMAVVRSL